MFTILLYPFACLPRRLSRAAVEVRADLRARADAMRPFHWTGRQRAWIGAFGAVVGLALLLTWELKTSTLEALVFSGVASQLRTTVTDGPSGSIVFPSDGPFDVRRGYARIPDITRRLEARGYRIVEQSEFSPALSALARAGVTPFHEPAQAGLLVRDASGDTLFDAVPNDDVFASYDDIPPVIVRTILYLENRRLGARLPRSSNPALDWGRLVKGAMTYSARALGLPARLEGGSTLAVQLQKFWHSPAGRTSSGLDKVRQILSASLSAYRDGPDTKLTRRQVVLDYLNTIPLGAVRGVGEIHGLRSGLRNWFGLDPDRVCEALRGEHSEAERARAFKHVLALLYSVRAPSRYLVREHLALEARLRYPVSAMAEAGVLAPEFAARVRAMPLSFSEGPAAGDEYTDGDERKAASRIRNDLRRYVGAPDLYALDGTHLEALSTVDVPLQRQVMAVFDSLRDADYVARHGLNGPRLLPQGDPAGVTYSLLLYERTPDGNRLRVQADNLNQPLDINLGVKLELGSTAKLRTLAHYLELMAVLHRQLTDPDSAAAAARDHAERDPMTRWAVATLADEPGLPLDEFLERALGRRYSASPGETFFTGGGEHHFHNFETEDDHRILSVRDATAHSTNLVYVRLMRDLVRYHAARLPYDVDAVFANQDDTTRTRLLDQIAEEESRTALRHAYREHRDQTEGEMRQALLGQRAIEIAPMATLFYAWNPGAPSDSLARWLADRLGSVPPDVVDRVAQEYGKPQFTLLDYAYLLHRDALELWTTGELVRHPNSSWDDLVAHSDSARQVTMDWLLHTSHKSAQDLRLRTRIERDAFERMTPYWQRLAFPFERMVPSLASAIGSSADRPSALAELMGIIVDNGTRRAPVTLERLSFAPGTPYHTVLEPPEPPGERVMLPVVAQTLRSVLADVVDHGTAQRLRGAFIVNGDTIQVGGKTGSGDNRLQTFARGGAPLTSTPKSRTAAFAFYVGDRYYGVITASVMGGASGEYSFTSSLPLAVLQLLAPAFEERLAVEPPRASDGPRSALDQPPPRADTARIASVSERAGRP